MATPTPRMKKTPDGTLLIERFSLIRRLEHLLVICSFTCLALTGFPQKYYSANWARILLDLCGGVDGIRRLHHFFGLLALTHLSLHLLAIPLGISLKKMRLSLLPLPQDFKDFWNTWKYHFGYSKEKPCFQFFNYRQKFEYFGILLGATVVMLSGFILLFPGFVTQWLPGHLIPAAREAHSSQAMLALLILVVWHIYGAHFTPEAFPMNKSIFTGYQTEEELKRHHKLEFDRIFKK